jgi:hypothetical protein
MAEMVWHVVGVAQKSKKSHLQTDIHIFVQNANDKSGEVTTSGDRFFSCF